MTLFISVSFYQKAPAQTIICNNYNIPCTHPEFFNEFHQQSLQTAPLSENLPYQLQDGINELHFQVPCGIIQDFRSRTNPVGQKKVSVKFAGGLSVFA